MPSSLRLFVDRLTVMDFSYLHPKRGLLGESWLVDVELSGALNYQGMLLDFSAVKKQIKQLIDAEFDHKLLLPLNNQRLSVENTEQNTAVKFRFGASSSLKHSSPPQALAKIDTDEITETSVSKALETRLKQILPDNISDITIHLYSEPNIANYYHYSHGLPKHDGNCQRIAHGHRSTIQILKNGQRSQSLEKQWCERWADIYIANQQDIKINGDDYYQFSYTSEQGLFELTLPKNVCYVMDTDSTVENIAWHIADKLQQNHPSEKITVKAFEGVGKGAIA